VVVRQYGKGRVVYAPGRLDAIQCDRLTPATERLFANAVRWVVGGQTPVEVASSAPVAVTLFDQPERRIVHLVSLNGDTRYASDEIAPIGNVRLQLRAPKGRQVTKVRRLWKAGDAPFQIDADKISVALEQVGEYEVLVAEWGAK
jgi:hypothetical protein